MTSVFSRRNLMRGIGAAALAPALAPLAAQDDKKPWWLGDGMPQESASTPKIACNIDLRNGVTDAKHPRPGADRRLSRAFRRAAGAVDSRAAAINYGQTQGRRH